MRLIDVDRALEIVRDQGNAHPNAYHLTNYATLILQEAPTIEAEPVKRGRWAYIGGDEWCCTNCGYVGSTEGRWQPMLDKFCSECGARMDGEV